MDRPESQVSGRNTLEVKCQSYVTSRGNTTMTYCCCCELWPPGWGSSCQISPLSILYSLEGNHHVNPTLVEWQLGPTSLREGIYINHLKFICTDLSVLPHWFTYSTIYLYQYGFSIFYNLGCNSLLCCLFAQILWALATSWLLCISDKPWSLWALVSTSLLFSTTRCSTFIVYIPCPSPRTSQSARSPGSFYQRNVLKTKIWVLGMLIVTGVVVFVGLLSWQSKEIHVCI